MNTRLPYAWARSQRILLAPGPQGLTLTVSPQTPDWALAEVRRCHGDVSVRSVGDDVLDTLIATAYAHVEDAAAVVDAAANEIDLDRLLQDMPPVEDLLDAHDEAPVIRMINALFSQALRDGASDIHIEAFETHSVVRYRIDGRLRDIVSPRRALHNALVSRIKIMASLDIAEKRLPQDGRIALRLGGRAVDVRVSTLPTGHGERTVLRLLDKRDGRLDLDALGMSPAIREQLDALIRQPHGIVLVTGPTGSGKTTTLYAALGRLDAASTNILTVEDPIEVDLPGIGQTQVNSRIALGFATALRAILRQDPDVIMIGEIRDLETARIAVQASLTGHLVLATLHTNDAISAVTRLTDMGIEPFLLASTLRGVLAQRLVRKLCPDCREPLPDGRSQAHDAGCAACGHTGYRGRTGIYELFVPDAAMVALIHAGQGEPALRAAARECGLATLEEDGARWLRAGVTSAQEVARVTRAS